jgi:predicted amidohydrolase YtcJ
VIEARTAALLEPYIGFNDSGTPNYTPTEMNAITVALDKAGVQVHCHAIGDRAIRMALDAMELAQKINGVRDSRHHIAHLELIEPQDHTRFRKLGVVANFQPLWAINDTYIHDLTIPLLGSTRSRWLYPMRSIVDTGS